MSKKFIGNIRILRKEVVHLSLEKLGDNVDDQMHVALTINMNDHQPGLQFRKGDQASVNMIFDLEILDPESDEEEARSLFKCHADIEMLFEFTRKTSFENSIASDYPEELLSLVYDDFRLILEANINRTSFKGLVIPVDFRSAIRL